MPLTDADDMWTQVTLSLRSQLAESVWFSTFQEVTPISVDDATFRLLAPSAYVRDRITTRYMPMIVDALDECGSRRSRDHDRQSIRPPSANAERHRGCPTSSTPHRVDTADVPVQPHAEDASERDHLLEAAGLSTDYTFDTFVKGASNQFALGRIAARRRDAGTQLQPAVHLRLGGARQDPSPATRSVTTSTRTTATTRSATSPPRRS